MEHAGVFARGRRLLQKRTFTDGKITSRPSGYPTEGVRRALLAWNYDWMPSLRWLRCRVLGGRDASFLPAYKNLHGVLALPRLIGVFKGVL
jgi:hypothetical protein